MSLTTKVCGHLRFFDILLENKHMNEPTSVTNMTTYEGNRPLLRTNCGHEINQDVRASVKGGADA